MPPIKIYPPAKLPEKGVTDLLFNVWTQELEIYLMQDERFIPFLPGGRYDTWVAADVNPAMIERAAAPDNAAELPARRLELKTFLSIIAKSWDIHHYNVVMRHSTSVAGIYKKLREDYDIQNKGIHFFNLLDMQYQPGASAVGFYNEYRNIVITNLKKRGDHIEWMDHEMERDEKLSPTFEDLILLTVLGLIDRRLPAHIRSHYHHHIGADKSLMDFKTDILVKIPTFLQEIEAKPQLNAIAGDLEEHLGAMRFEPSGRFRGATRGRGGYRPRAAARGFHTAPIGGGRRNHFTTPYCRLCHLTGQPDSVTRSHRIGDPECPKLSQADKEYIWSNKRDPRVNAVSAADETEELAQEYGYTDTNLQEEESSQDQVQNHSLSTNTDIQITNTTPRPTSTSVPSCNFISPVPSQILTVFTADHQPVHIELDSNATVNYIKLDAAKHFNFKICPNSQLSILADVITKLPAVGEIHETFFRNDWSVKFSAIVVKNLHTAAIGGTVFLRDNNIKQDFSKNTIQVHTKYTVSSTSPAMIAPIQPYNHLCKINANKTLLPHQDFTILVPHENNTVVSVEPWAQNVSTKWPTP
jgi:hypothetical protein